MSKHLILVIFSVCLILGFQNCKVSEKPEAAKLVITELETQFHNNTRSIEFKSYSFVGTLQDSNPPTYYNEASFDLQNQILRLSYNEQPVLERSLTEQELDLVDQALHSTKACRYRYAGGVRVCPMVMPAYTIELFTLDEEIYSTYQPCMDNFIAVCQPDEAELNQHLQQILNPE